MILFSRWPYAYFSIPAGVQVTWASHSKSCLFHATVDGKIGLCGAGGLTDEIAYPSVYDPSDDGMTCKNCQWLVRRVTHTRGSRNGQKHVDQKSG